MSAEDWGLIPNTFPTSENVGDMEAMRFIKVSTGVNHFYTKGIQDLIFKIAEDLKVELEQTAPVDPVPYDDYYMTEHMSTHPIKNGRATESEAAYSGHLEYGTAYHGVRHVFFRPATEKFWKKYKEEVVKQMKEILSK